jgi:hypothetical protein
LGDQYTEQDRVVELDAGQELKGRMSVDKALLVTIDRKRTKPRADCRFDKSSGGLEAGPSEHIRRVR